MTAVVLFALSSALTWQLSGLLSVLSGAFVSFLAFGCPLWFMHVQESKKYVAARVLLLLVHRAAAAWIRFVCCNLILIAQINLLSEEP